MDTSKSLTVVTQLTTAETTPLKTNHLGLLQIAQNSCGGFPSRQQSVTSSMGGHSTCEERIGMFFKELFKTFYK